MAVTPTVLIVEDSKFFASMLSRRIQDELGYKVDWKSTYADAVKIIDCCRDNYLVALLDLNLPDAPNGEIIDYALQKGIPSIVFTGNFDVEQRNKFVTWNLVDYILKDSNASVELLLSTIKRLHKNRSTKVLVVDDSRTLRDSVAMLLRTQLFQVLEAGDGVEALEVLEENPDIKLVLTDYDMPRMDGFDLIRKIRAEHSKNDLAIIGMSASDEEVLSARLIKTGANDFIPKPFHIEEFHVRINHAVEMLNNIELIRDLSYKDPLTRLYNRRYFFENADKFIERSTKSGKSHCVGMLDIDFFKKVNDTYGHDGGDEVLKMVSAIVAEHFSEDAIVSRFGGEEFCVLVSHAPSDNMVGAFDGLRQGVERASIQYEGQEVKVTISVGICCEPLELEAMLKLSDSRLYTAKEGGRNRVVGDPPSPNVRR
ncbi:diguanylate cyclase [Pseudodesulfovibrio sp. zrk46]|uniref:diguanylate cyclase n=1 Tax=Pseudodesulfovibrio sp. zrk46 TaxID=2725288 RepID=UPI001449DA43|nr:diguanylate cyclase [Pseudodesulfovibrio sp. zrk46]QJB55816.1 diguanylate cyclase [Pseudodesulfovibrio sp. zrk46]